MVTVTRKNSEIHKVSKQITCIYHSMMIPKLFLIIMYLGTSDYNIQNRKKVYSCATYSEKKVYYRAATVQFHIS